ncbi:MAG: hypothetical protein JJ959_04410 [Nisaea sp.]|uniref:hypothetical protein n=1 Tax=Nisaea sp. TaxID=2024842 RepID=UPI001B2CE860|nr:hypothetical protein [Nisaea sp.]MBO6559752.1 hypothetical protein [Nisaea sp.]
MDSEIAINQIDNVLERFRLISERSEEFALDDVDHSTVHKVFNMMASVARRFSVQSSTHSQELDRILSQGKPGLFIRSLAGLLMAMRDEYELGYLQSIEELVHANTFASFVEMAQHLISQGYKDAAAVIVGSILEQHLRQLCQKNGIPPEENGKFRKSEALNVSLSSKGIINKLDQKNITAWLGLRNNAAHGNYDEYDIQQVKLMLSSIQNFIMKYPA